MTEQHASAERTYRKNVRLQELGKLESVSGVGSSHKAASSAICFITSLLKELNIQSVCDIPCGDLNWSKRIDWTGITYHGCDIVHEIVDANSREFPKLEFHQLDAIHEVPPPADLIICRDFLFHLHFRDALKVLDNFRRSGSNLLVTTSFNELHQNTDLPTGRWYGYRPINVKIAPFSLGEPVKSVLEFGARSLNLYVLQSSFSAENQFSDAHWVPTPSHAGA